MWIAYSAFCCANATRLYWLVDLQLDFHYFLPIFFSGLREKEHPYSVLAYVGSQEMLTHGGDKVLPVIPQLIIPLTRKSSRLADFPLTLAHSCAWVQKDTYPSICSFIHNPSIHPSIHPSIRPSVHLCYCRNIKDDNLTCVNEPLSFEAPATLTHLPLFAFTILKVPLPVPLMNHWVSGAWGLPHNWKCANYVRVEWVSMLITSAWHASRTWRLAASSLEAPATFKNLPRAFLFSMR